MRYPIRHIYRHQDYVTPRRIEGYYPHVQDSPGWVWWLTGAIVGLIVLLLVVAKCAP